MACRSTFVSLGVTVLLSAISTVASAHPRPGSVAHIDLTVDGARVEHDAPLEELEQALHYQLILPGETLAAATERQAGTLRSYARDHLSISSAGDGREWVAGMVSLSAHEAADGPRVRFELAFVAPAGTAPATAVLWDDIIVHEVKSHYTRVYLRSAWALGPAPVQPRLLGAIRTGRYQVSVGDVEGDFWSGLSSVVGLGIHHIATGVDHLMFLFALLLIAPITAMGGRWRCRSGLRIAVVRVVQIVSAFTIGHSLTLALGALNWVPLPEALIEVLIALSVLISAIHAMRPLFPAREAWVAGAFGLIHGLAFANLLGHRDHGLSQTLWTLFGFNLGIEVAQLGLIVVTIPWLVLLSGTRFYPLVRRCGAGLAAILALGWLAERTLSVPSPTAPVVTFLGDNGPLVLALLVLAALSAKLGEFVLASKSSPGPA